MNRAVKTSLIFIGAIALFFLLIHLETWLTKVEDWLNPPTTSLELFERDIAHEWVESGQWDKALFERQLSRLNDEYSKGNLKKRERASLLSLMGESAWREIDSVFQVQMSAPNSRKAEVDANKKGLDYLTGFKDSRNGDGTPFKESEHISGSLKMYQDYVRAMSFATKNLTASPSIDAHFKWTPFSVIQSRWDSEKDKVASSPYFASHFRNINVVKNRWNEYASLVNSARTSFRNQLSQNLPGVISQALTPIKTEAETERQNGRDVLADSSSPDYPTLAVQARNKLQSVYDRLDVFCKDASDAMSRFGNEVGTGSSAYSKISDINTNASRERMETSKVKDLL